MADEPLLHQLVRDQIEAAREQAKEVGALTSEVRNLVEITKEHIRSDVDVHSRHEGRLDKNDTRWTDLRARVATWALVFSGVGAVLMVVVKEAAAAVAHYFTHGGPTPPGAQ